MSRRGLYIRSALLLIWTAAIYYRLRNGYFVGEDYNYFTYARYSMRYTSVWEPFYLDYLTGMWFRPLVLVLWYISFRLAGLSMWAYYAIDGMILWMTGVFIVKLCRQMGASSGTALLAATLFIAHPITGSTFSYLAARGDVLGACFAVIALSLHIKSRSSPRFILWRSAAVLAAICSYLCKEMFMSLPLMILIIPLEIGTAVVKGNAHLSVRYPLQPVGESHPRSERKWVAHLREFTPYFLAAMTVMVWRSLVIGNPVGGYVFQRTTIGLLLLRTPRHIIETIMLLPRMIGVYGLPFIENPVNRLMIAIAVSAGLGLWIVSGIRKLSSSFALLAAGWVILAILPVSNFPDVLEMSPRLLYFPLAMIVIWLASLKPDIKAAAVGMAFLMLVAWLPLNQKIISGQLAKSKRFERVAMSTHAFYLKDILKGPDNRIIVVFGVPEDIYTLDCVFKDTLPSLLDPFKSPAFNVRFLSGERVTFTAVMRQAQTTLPEQEAFKDMFDYETRDYMLFFKSRAMIAEYFSPPDIPHLLTEGKNVTVGYYNSASNKYRDMTELFKLVNKLRAEAVPAPPVHWDFRGSLEGWQPDNQLQVTDGASSIVMRSTGVDPYMTVRGLSIDPIPIAHWEIKMRVERSNMFTPVYLEAHLSWKSPKPPPFDLKSELNFPIKADGQWHTYKVKVGAWPGWYLAERVTSLRLDPVAVPALIELDSIKAVPYTTAEKSP